MKIIEIKNLSKKFFDSYVLKNISLTINKGEVVSVIGPSGSGKSTLLRCIINLESFDEGNIYIENKSSTDKVALLKTSMVFQNFNLFPNKTVIENLILSPILVKNFTKSKATKLAEYYLKKVNLLDKKNKYPSSLSGGQQQRTAIARALTMQPDIILFDEPTSSLDPELTNEVLQVIKKLAKEITILIVSHEMNFVQEISDKVIFIDQGKIVASGPPRDIFYKNKNQRLKKFLKTIKYKF